jgi:DNA-binding response OmpR family regulator
MAIAHLNSFRSPAAPAPAPHLALVTETEARGFALYVGLDEATAAAAGTSLVEVAAALRRTLAELVPAAAEETYAAVALAPIGIGGRPVDVARAALQNPKTSGNRSGNTAGRAAKGIVIDLNRKKVFADGTNADLTQKEFELVSYLVENEGETISRRELVDAVWADDEAEAPNDRTIDVHVRRLRAKIAGYEDIIRTIRGVGYRFDKHPDVLVEA